MKIQFINPPYIGRFSRAQRSPGVIKSGTLYYPYWLTYAAAVAEARGHDIDLVDCPADGLSPAQLSDRIRAFRPQMIVMETVTASWEADCRTAGELKKQFPSVFLLMAGTHVTALWRETLLRQPAVDAAVIGEYDLTPADLADALQNGRSPLEVPGLALRNNGRIVRTAERPLIENLDDLPWIAPLYKRFLHPRHYYFNLSLHPMVMLIGGRGCTAMCFYCVYPQVVHGHRYRHRSPENIVGELLWVQENMPEIREITFEDDNFAADPFFARNFAEEARRRGVRLPFFANLRTTVDFETLKALKEAGLRRTAVGFESGDDRILHNMRKGQNAVIQQRFADDARRLGILVHGCFMVGFPGETPETMEKTLRLAFKLKPDSAQFYPVMPYPGTGAYEFYARRGYLAATSFRDWLTDDGGHRCVLNLPGLPPQVIETFCEKAFRRFHFCPAYLGFKLLQALRSPREGLRSAAAGLQFVKYLLCNQRRRQKPFQAKPRPVPSDWFGRLRVPMGRMERLRKGLGEIESPLPQTLPEADSEETE